MLTWISWVCNCSNHKQVIMHSQAKNKKINKNQVFLKRTKNQDLVFLKKVRNKVNKISKYQKYLTTDPKI